MGINVANSSNDQVRKTQTLPIALTKEQKLPLEKDEVL